MFQGTTSRERADTESSAQERQQVLGQSGRVDVRFLGREPPFLSQHRLQQTSGRRAGAFDFGAAFFCARWCHHGRVGRGGCSGDFFIWKARRGNLLKKNAQGEKYCVVLWLPSWSYQVLSDRHSWNSLSLFLYFSHTHTHKDSVVRRQGS